MKHSQTQEISHDPLVNANILNSHFASVGNRLASELLNSNRHFSNYLPRTTYSGSFVFETVLPSEIELEIIMAPSNKAHGLYSCPIRLLKCSRHIISKPIANIVNQSVCMGMFPSKLKHAKIIPIYKDGNEDESSNYRPISILSIFNRLFEKVMYNRLKSFLNKYNVLNMVSVSFDRLTMPFWTLLIKFNRTWTRVCSPEVSLLIYKKRLILLITLSFYRNFFTMELVES